MILFGLLTVVFLASVPYGTVYDYHKALVVFLISGLAAARVIRDVIRKQFMLSEPVLLMPLAGVILIAVVQLMALPSLGLGRISFDPYGTKVFIAVFASVIIAGELLYRLTRSTRELASLVVLVLATGAASAIFGVLRESVFSDPAGFVATSFAPDTQGYAQFINRNHFVLLMEMALGLTVGLLLKGGLSEKLKFVGWLLSALFIYTSIAANSRGGLISIGALGLFAAFVHVLTRHGRDGKDAADATRPGFWRKALAGTAICCAVFAAFAFIVSFVGGDRVVSRIEKIRDEVATTEEVKLNRLAIWRATADMVEERPLMGFGFGAYATAFPAYDESAGKWTVEQAHNDYLEILANGGIAGFLMFAIFAVLVVRRALRNLYSDYPLVRSSCFGALIGIFGVMVHSVVDFGLHIVVNALIFTILVVIATVRLPSTTLPDAAST